MKRINFWSLLTGLLVEPFALLTILNNQWVRGAVSYINNIFNFGDLINSSASMFVYFVVLSLPLIAVFFLTTMGLWKFIKSINSRYSFTIVSKMSLFFALGAAISIIVLQVILNFSVV